MSGEKLVHLSGELVARLDRLVAELAALNMSRSAFAEIALTEYIETCEKPDPQPDKRLVLHQYLLLARSIKKWRAGPPLPEHGESKIVEDQVALLSQMLRRQSAGPCLGRIAAPPKSGAADPAPPEPQPNQRRPKIK